ncbi:hypothetical protein AB2M62_11750 [Sphingomonas sp. MMS12-HWE2-04]|uniref:hypothetical protein n=1 Tax=Sphingomonas sp. MMS12-HWE2-04 TaxID=3234199 RepID=UPI00384CCE0D
MAGQAGLIPRAAALAAGALALVAAAPLDPVQALAGRYSTHFENATVDGDKYWSDDVVEIVPVDARHAYFNLNLHFANGHSCGLSGVAQAQGDTLDYVAPARSRIAACHMTLSRQGRWLHLDDHDGTCQSTCGSRGGYGGEGQPWKSKRPITYMKLLKASSDYREALEEWRKASPLR